MAQETSRHLGEGYVFVENVVVAGQPAIDGLPAALQIFADGPNGWYLAGTHVVTDISENDRFAAAMDMDDELLAVGAPLQSDSTGAVYLFRHDEDSNTFELVEHLVADTPGSRLGSALDLQGDLLVAGMPGINGVLVVKNVGSSEASQTTLTSSDAQDGDYFGASVATDGEHVYVGAPRRNDDAGGVYVFAPGESGYTQEALVELRDEKTLGRNLIAIDSGRVITSAPGLSIQERQAAGEPDFNSRRDNRSTGPILEVARTTDGWVVRTVVDDLVDFTLARMGRIPMAATADRVFVGKPESQSVQSYVHDAESRIWSKSRTYYGTDRDVGFGMSIARHGDRLAVLAFDAAHGLGGIVIYFASKFRSGREDHLRLVENSGSAHYGRVECTDGAALHFGCGNVDMLAFMPIDALAGRRRTTLNDIWGWTDPLTGSEYALVGRTDGTAFVNITSPASPTLVGDLPLTDGANSGPWRDIKVYDNHAFIVADGSGNHGMQVFDLTQLRDVSGPPAKFSPLTTYHEIGSAHNIAINEATGIAFIIGSSGSRNTCGGGLHIVNIQDPTEPQFAGCFVDTDWSQRRSGYTHDAQCVIYNGPDTEHQGKEICFSANVSMLSIADVTDKDSTVALSRAAYPGVRYAHQGWLADDHVHFYMNDEIDEMGREVEGTRTLIWDVSDLDDPQLAHEYISDNTASDHNLYIHGDYMYQSNYASGLRIVDISDPVNPVEVGFFDPITVIPDGPGFFGSWSNYPYFESGTIVITSMGEGLFVLKKRDVDT